MILRKLKPTTFDLGATGIGLASPFLMGAVIEGAPEMSTFQMIIIGFAVTAGGIAGKAAVVGIATAFRAYRAWTLADKDQRNNLLGYIAGSIGDAIDPEHKGQLPAPPSQAQLTGTEGEQAPTPPVVNDKPHSDSE